MENKAQKQKPNIAITGLTAAGKTTHALITQAEFKLGYVSGATLLLEKVGISKDVPSDFWISPAGHTLSQQATEFNLDETLRDEEISLNNTIFDCRSLPWLTRSPILSIWLESSLDSRTWKAMVSHSKKKEQRTTETMRKEIYMKDKMLRDGLLYTFGFDIFHDYEPMDVILDISDFITGPSIYASWRSIQMVQDIISSLVGLYLSNDHFYRLRLRNLREVFGPSVFRHFSARFKSFLDE